MTGAEKRLAVAEQQLFELVLERREQENETARVQMGGVTAEITPIVHEDYWQYRVKLPGKQAVVGFPKFGTIGIGFAVEEDWNTNLPYACSTLEIVSHIFHNAFAASEKDEYGEYEDDITVAMVYAAVELIQEAATRDRPDKPAMNTQPAYRQFTVRREEPSVT